MAGNVVPSETAARVVVDGRVHEGDAVLGALPVVGLARAPVGPGGAGRRDGSTGRGPDEARAGALTRRPGVGDLTLTPSCNTENE